MYFPYHRMIYPSNSVIYVCPHTETLHTGNPATHLPFAGKSIKVPLLCFDNFLIYIFVSCPHELTVVKPTICCLIPMGTGREFRSDQFLSNRSLVIIIASLSFVLHGLTLVSTTFFDWNADIAESNVPYKYDAKYKYISTNTWLF